MKYFGGLSLLPLAAALNFQWTHDGQEYWATEIDRIDVAADTYNLTGHIGHEGLGYFKVGEVDWPQFCRLVDTDAYEPGAYVVATMSGQLVVAKAYQMMPDPAQAFMTGVIPDTCGDGAYKEYSGAGIPVPPSAGGDGPLAGLRFAVKDLYHVKGVKTSGGSASYYKAFPPQNETSGMVLKVLGAGAELVGKTKTTAFALTDTRNGWEVDYHDPFNHRGDGYISTSGSSSGSLAATVAYDWIDFAIGSDTGGSVRGPATRGGVFGYRPSPGFLDLGGIVPCVASLDTPGFFTRSPALFTKLFPIWTEGSELAKSFDSFSMPTKLLVKTGVDDLPDYISTPLKTFIGKVTDHFNMSSSPMSIEDTWMKNIVNRTFDDYFVTTYLDLNSVDSWDLIGVPLYEAFGSLTGGDAPPVDPSVNRTWANGQNETIRSRYQTAEKDAARFHEFYSEYILPTNPETCSESLLVSTYDGAEPANRENLIPFGVTGDSSTGPFWDAVQGSFGRISEIIVPFTQIPYWSNYTLQTEYRPLTATFQAARGCDAVLFKMVDELAKAGIISEVQTGSLTYPL